MFVQFVTVDGSAQLYIHEAYFLPNYHATTSRRVAAIKQQSDCHI